MIINQTIKAADLCPKILRMWELSAQKIHELNKRYDHSLGSPVFTREGKYTTRGWTEWTQGFEFGSQILQFDATLAGEFLESGRQNTVNCMASHVTHFGVHDHGFNNISTYGNLLRLCAEGRIAADAWEQEFYKLALKCSGAVQARRWTQRGENTGYIHSFNGPQSLFVDTIRTLRVLAVAHKLGHTMMGEGDEKISLLKRLVQHAKSTAEYSIYYGDNRDSFDVCGRTAHEVIFNTANGQYRCPSSQQGYSSFTTWTRGLAWAMCGFAEQLEFIESCPDIALEEAGGRKYIENFMLRAAMATCDFYIQNTARDGIPYWDTGAPGLAHLGDYMSVDSHPFNDYEPVDSSAAAIAAQGLLRFGHYLAGKGSNQLSEKYWQAGLTVLDTLLQEPYLSIDSIHEGLLLHSVYHKPNGWDFIPAGRKIPCGESSMWGDYHLREVALYAQRIAESGTYLAFYNV